jgi:pimeloyl-ACP methyl ester carboxylesterase
MEPTGQKHGPNILLVHGGFADGSIWIPVIERLQRQGCNVVASQMPLTSFDHDVRAVERDLGSFQGPTVVVGHSYGGIVITEAATGKANVCGLVYVAGAAVDIGETVAGILAEHPVPAAEFIVSVDRDETPPFVIIQRDKIPEFFCPDIPRKNAKAVAATAAPMSATIFTAQIRTPPAWQQVPTWYLIFSEDQILRPDAQMQMAKRAAAPDRIDSIKASHAGIVSHPAQVANFIMQAANDYAATLRTSPLETAMTASESSCADYSGY